MKLLEFIRQLLDIAHEFGDIDVNIVLDREGDKGEKVKFFLTPKDSPLTDETDISIWPV